MADQVVMMELLKSDCKNFRESFKEKLKKNIGIVIPNFLMIGLIISLCTVVSVLHEKQNSNLVDCVLRPTLEKGAIRTCSYVDRYPLSNEVYAMVCSNETIQIDIRRFRSGKPSVEGITLSRIQWQYLKSSVDHIDESILKST